MTTLRDRLVALAHARRRERFGASIEGYESLALAAARLALEDAEQECNRRYMGDNNREDMEARRCAAAIRALRDGLE